MVWGAISHCRLIFIEKDWGAGNAHANGTVSKGGTVTGQMMINYILPHLSSYRNAYKEHIRKVGIPKSFHPSNSPDLNLIKPIWKLLKERVYSHRPRNSQVLRHCIAEEWEKLTVDKIRVYIGRMKQHCEAVLAKKADLILHEFSKGSRRLAYAICAPKQV